MLEEDFNANCMQMQKGYNDQCVVTPILVAPSSGLEPETL